MTKLAIYLLIFLSFTAFSQTQRGSFTVFGNVSHNNVKRQVSTPNKEDADANSLTVMPNPALDRLVINPSSSHTIQGIRILEDLRFATLEQNKLANQIMLTTVWPEIYAAEQVKRNAF